MTKGRLALLEGHWGLKDPSMTVSPLFNMVLSSQKLPAATIDYERWRTRVHLVEALTRHATSAEIIYLGGHAEKTGVIFDDQVELTVAEIIKALRKADLGPLTGVYLSMCSIGSPDTAKKLLKALPRLEWVAGYSARVSWAESAAIDLLFFNRWYGLSDKNLQKINNVAAYMEDWAGHLSLANDVQFNIYTRDGALMTGND